MPHTLTGVRLRVCAALVFALTGGAALATEPTTPGIYVEGGRSLHSHGNADALSLGYVLPATGWRFTDNPSLGFYWDFFVSQWRAPAADREGRRGYTQIGAIATYRWRFDQGRSPWFAEAGLGATLMDRLYRTPEREFSTAFQFTEVLGAGYNFGAQNQHELSLRLQHVSNAAIKQPNPGENFLRLRYTYRY